MENTGYEIDKRDGYLIISGISRDILDINKTFDCGQCFRWRRVGDNYWQGVVNSRIYIIGQLDLDRLVITSTEDGWRNELYDYLDLNTDYSVTVPTSDTFALKAMEFGKGIRILKQDPWETLISFIISQRNNIPRIKIIIDRLCKAYGDRLTLKIPVSGGVRECSDYSFPTVERLASLSLSDLSGIGLGYRDEYIVSAAKAMQSNPNLLIQLKDVNSEDALHKLLSFKGVGQKVANCVALFGLHKLDMFPIDVWIQRVIDEYYNGNIDISQYGSLAGLVQQYMFYYIKNKKD